MFEIKVTVDIPSLVEAARIIAMGKTTAVEAKPERIEEIRNAPVMAMPAAAPITPAPALAPVPAHTPVPAPAPAPVAAVPVSPAPPIQRADVARAGAALLSQNPALQPQLVALLGEFKAQTVQDIPEDQLGAFATRLRGMGARI